MSIDAGSASPDVPLSSDSIPVTAGSMTPGGGDFVRIGVEEEFHVVDLQTRELVAQAPRILADLPAETYSDELQRSIVESHTPVCEQLSELREALVETRRRMIDVARDQGLGIVAAGTVPLVDPLRLAVTPTSRYERMLADYQLLVREQLICGAQVHVQITDRDLAVAVAQRVTPYLPVLLAISARTPATPAPGRCSGNAGPRPASVARSRPRPSTTPSSPTSSRPRPSATRGAYQRRGRLADVVDLLLERTDPATAPPSLPGTAPAPAHPLPLYRRPGDEVLGAAGPAAHYAGVLELVEHLGATALRRRERLRDEEQRSRGVTFGVTGGASGRLFPVDLVPRIVQGEDWARLRPGLVQRARALDAFLHDVYADRAVVRDGIVPAWVVDAAPGLRSVGAILQRQRVRAHVCGMDLVREGAGNWLLLEDNVRVPSGLGYAVQSRRLSAAVMPDLPRPRALLDVEAVPALLGETLQAAAMPAAPDTPNVVLLSEGPEGSAWFEHRMLGEEMGVPVAVSTDLLVDDGTVYLLREGRRRRVDVLYLRIDEDVLLHATGADGRPLGASLRAGVDAGRVALANAPGNGVGDDKAIYAYVPKLIEYYLGERPLLDSVPTYLCAVPEQRDDVLGRLDRVVLKPVDGYGGEGVVIGPLASEEELAATRRQVLAAPHRWIAQEMIELSTHPCFDGERLVPRHVDLRAFVFHGDGLKVAPAALTRVAPEGSLVVNSSCGGGSKDTWLLGEDA
jgi:uncharacterized circularly permuted ATP-grasp superfamily protein